MEADFSVELGADDETLEMPWAAEGRGPRYYDLKRHPEFLLNIEEAHRVQELGEFLAAMNSPASAVETAKCDVWTSTEISPHEEVFGSSHKFGSYVDLILSAEDARFSFPRHEQFVRKLTQLLRKAPETPSAAEFIIRRCYFHGEGGMRAGLYITFYLFGYGDGESTARQGWAIALKLVENAIRQMSSAIP